MLPIYIVCHAACEPAGYLCYYLRKNNINYKKITAFKNEIASLDLDAVSGLVFMGGPYSVNEDLPWVADEIQLVQQAMEKDIPIMGVCLGAQLISKALGADIHSAAHMETGWHKMKVDTSKLTDYPALELDETFEVFEWHEETFSIPEGATPIFKGLNYENQGYVYGKILNMQFHLEMTEEMIYEWIERYHHCIPEPSLYVQTPEQITVNLEDRLDNLYIVADKIYDWWLSWLKRD